MSTIEAINGYQLQMQDNKDFRTFINSNIPSFDRVELKEIKGITLGLFTHSSIVHSHADFHCPKRSALDARLHDDLNEGKMTHYEYYMIRQINIELDKAQIELGDDPHNAIINAITEMHQSKQLFIQNPIAYIQKKLECEAKIAEAFKQEGSHIGHAAHFIKGYMDASICLASAAIKEYSEAQKSGLKEKVERHKGEMSSIREGLKDSDNDDSFKNSY